MDQVKKHTRKRFKSTVKAFSLPQPTLAQRHTQACIAMHKPTKNEKKKLLSAHKLNAQSNAFLFQLECLECNTWFLIYNYSMTWIAPRPLNPGLTRRIRKQPETLPNLPNSGASASMCWSYRILIPNSYTELWRKWSSLRKIQFLLSNASTPNFLFIFSTGLMEARSYLRRLAFARRSYMHTDWLRERILQARSAKNPIHLFHLFSFLRFALICKRQCEA